LPLLSQCRHVQQTGYSLIVLQRLLQLFLQIIRALILPPPCHYFIQQMNPHVNQYYGIVIIVLMMIQGTAGLSLAAQGAGKPELRFQQISHRLTTNTVTAIAEDSFGFIWVGTNSGLNRFDGVRFLHYHSSDEKNSLSDNVVGSIFVDSNEDIWISGRSTMSRYRRETDDFERFDLPDPTGTGVFRRVRTITEDSHGVIWVGGGPHSLYYLDRINNRFEPYHSLQTHDITNIVICDKNFIWASTERSGLQRIDTNNGTVTSYLHDPDDPKSISSNRTTSVARDRSGSIWVGSQDGGVNRLVISPDGNHSFERYLNEPGKPDALQNNHIYTMYVDRQERLWLGNDNGGLHLYDYEKDIFHHYKSDPDDPYSLSHPSVSRIFQDHTGRLWVGTAFSGLNVADRYAFKFRHYHTRSRLSNRFNNNIVRDFSEDSSGNIWIATDGGGLNHLDRSTGFFRAFQHDPENRNSILSDAVVSISRDRQGRLWTGTYNGGLQLLVDEEAGTFLTFEEHYGITPKLFHNPFDIYFDREHPYLWVAELRRGVFRFHTETGESKQFNPVRDDTTSLVSNFVLHIFEDSRNNLWFASLSGLSKLTPENKHTGIFRRYLPDDDDPSSIPGSTIRQITEDGLGRVWVATEKGLALYQPETDNFYVFDESDGLPRNELRSLAADKNHDLWIGSVLGLTRFHPETSQFQNFREEDGLQGDEFNPYAGSRLSTGEMLFGGMNGFNLFHPDSLQTNPYIPPVYITDFKLFNESVTVNQANSPLDSHITVTEKVTLAHWQNVITFEFIALNFTNAEQNQYAYMMEGFDSDWVSAGTQRNATYTNLNPGTYHFHVRASNNDGIWNEEGTTLTLVIVPPFWKTTWFYIAVILTGILILFIGFRIKVHNIRVRNIKLEKTVSRRTRELRESNKLLRNEIEEKKKVYSVLAHDLRNPFMSIIGFSEYLAEKLEDDKDEEKREISKMVLESSKSLFQLLENLLEWASAKRRNLKPRKEPLKLHTMVDKAFRTNQLSAESKGVRLQNNFPEDVVALGDKNMIQTVLRNLVSNAIKFSREESSVTVSVQEKDDRYVISVSDSGVGMTKEEQKKILSASGSHRRTGTKGEKGIGFGLMLCKDFINENGGELRVESEKDKGSSFFFTLDKAEPNKSTARLIASSANP